MQRSVRYRLPLALALAFAISGCGATRSDPGVRASGPALVSPAPSSAAPTSAGPTPSATASPSAAFVGEITPVTAAQVAHSWHAGCPVGPDQLSLLRLSYWGFDGRPHVGSLVVAKAVAHNVVTVFGMLYGARFPIRQLQPVDAYAGSDDASMAADNTSAFNCRNAVANGPPRWSEHAYGRAVDVNPVENPYLLGNRVLPPAGSAYTDRSKHVAGMAFPGGTLVKAFASVGWKWRGTVAGEPDYQHFSSTGG